MKTTYKRIFWISVFVLLLVLLLVTLQDPYAIHQEKSLTPPSKEFLLGTDYLGRDLWSRIIIGGGYSFLLTIISLVCVIAVSLLFGGLAGFSKGLVDAGITTVADMLISLPTILLVLVFTGFVSNSVLTVMIALTLSWSGKYIRYIRNLVLEIRNEEYILLAPLHGSFGGHTLLFHVFPNVMRQLVSLFMNDIGKVMVSISGLSFLGIGVQPPIPELGTILYDGKVYFFSAPWLFLFPGLVLSLVVLITHYSSEKLKKKYGDYR